MKDPRGHGFPLIGSGLVFLPGSHAVSMLAVSTVPVWPRFDNTPFFSTKDNLL